MWEATYRREPSHKVSARLLARGSIVVPVSTQASGEALRFK